MALQGDGKIVAVGTTDIHGSHTSAFALARYKLNGSLDPSFSGDGKQTTDLVFGEFAGASGVAIQADGKIVAVGDGALTSGPSRSPASTRTARSTRASPATACRRPTSGVASTRERGGAPGRRQDRRGRHRLRPRDDFALARYNPDGSLDTSFSGDGKQTTDFSSGPATQANDVAIQANGRIVAVGVAGGGATGDDFGLARYNPNGSLDTSFSGDGRKRTSFGGFDSANGVALQGDGRIVAVGAGNGEFALARYLGG